MTENVVTLISNPINQFIDNAIVNQVYNSIEKHGGKVLSSKNLAENEAVDIFFTNVDSTTLANELKKSLKEKAVDIVIQPVNGRKKQMLICDMDSTIIQQECIDELADLLGIKEKVATITEQAMNGQIEFKQALRQRVRLLEGLPEATLEQVYSDRISLTDGAKTLVQTMRNNGAYTVLVSGGFTFFTGRVTKDAGFHEHHANKLGFIDGQLSGSVVEPILDKEAKVATLQAVSKAKNIKLHEIMAVGDGANDIPMLQEAGIGIAFHAKPVVQQQIRYAVNHGNLTALLFIQGYSRSEFVE